MNKVRKLLAVIIAGLTILSAFAGISAFAADSYTVTVKSSQNLFSDISKSYKAGDTFDLVYYVKAEKKLIDGTVDLKYDNSSLEIEDDSCVSLGEKFPKSSLFGNYSKNKGAYIVAYSAQSGNVADYSSESVLLKFTFKVLDTISKSQTIDFDIDVLGARGTIIDDNGKEKADSSKVYNYVFDHSVDSSLSDGFKVRVELTGGADVKPETEPDTKPETQPVTKPVTVPTVTTNPASETTTTPASETKADSLYGDSNEDGTINVKDVTLIQKHIVNLTALSEKVQKKCDVNSDGNLNIKDATCIQWYLVLVQSRAGKTGEAFISE